jgi:hypothetical protein
MILGVFFILIFPFILVSLLSFPMFLWLKNSHYQNRFLYPLSGSILGFLISILFVILIENFSQKDISVYLISVAIVTVYGVVLGCLVRRSLKVTLKS